MAWAMISPALWIATHSIHVRTWIFCEDVLSAHYEQYGRVVKVLVAHSKAMQAAGILFVAVDGVMCCRWSLSVDKVRSLEFGLAVVPSEGKMSLDKFNQRFHVGKLNTGIMGTWCRECSCNWSQKKKTMLAFNPGSEQAFHSLLAVFA